MDKIKQLFSKLIENKKLLWSIVAIVAVVTVVAIVLGVVLSKDEPAPADDSIKDCTIKIETVGGMPLENIGIYIYKDSSKEDLISFNRTDKMGVASIDVGVPENSIIVLDGIPEGYSVEESYQITKKETEIKLSAELLEEMTDIKKGGIMFDFTVTDPDGKEYTLSEILKKKKAVVLNLWYTGCQPCKMEFPYLQTAYEKYSEDIEVLAINPEASDNDDAVASFKADNNITFPMAKCSEDWKKVVSGLAYPTTIVIDRFNSIAMIHTGSVDNAKTFKDAFEFFCADDYKQTVVDSINDLKTDAPEERDGSLELPYEIKDVAEFDIKAESGTTVYYEIYGKAGKVFSCVDKAIKVIYDETTFEPDENDLITFFINDENADSPVVIGFINDGEETLECKAIFEEPNGTADDPYILDLGNTTVNLIAGNKNGLNYSYSSEVNGVYSIIAKSSDEVSDFEVILTNVDKNIIKNLSDDGIKDSKTGTEKLSVDVSRGDNITVAIVAKADEFGMYPAMSVLITAEAADKTDTTMSENDKNPDESTVDGSVVDPVDSTIATPEDTTKTPEDTTAKPEDTTKAPVDTTKAPENVTSKPEDTTKAPEDTTKRPEDTTAKPEDTEDTTVVDPPVQSEDVLVNPNEAIEIGSMLEFDATVDSKTKVLYHLYKLSGSTLTISDPDAYVVYEGVKYTAENGVVKVPVESEGPTVAIVVEIGNSGKTNKTFKVNFVYPVGSFMNPLALSLGNIETKVEQGNEQGVYYTYTATGDGILTFELLNATNGADANITLYNLVSYEQLSINKEAGETSVSIEFYEGDTIQIIIATLPDDKFNYPATTILSNAYIEPIE